jgi:hypothetical protein
MDDADKTNGCSQPPPNPGYADERSESVGLSFVDLLYAVPVAVLATRLDKASPSNVPAAGWTSVALALTAITLGWVGHHANRKTVPPAARVREDEEPFTTARFPQFVVEILIIAAYFALAKLAVLGDGRQPELAQTVWLAIAFALYLVWDLLDIHIAASFGGDWPVRAVRGTEITYLFALLFVAAVLLTLATRHHRLCSAVVFDVSVIAALLAYRIVQELHCAGWRKPR